jgi:hypothetical protein
MLLLRTSICFSLVHWHLFLADFDAIPDPNPSFTQVGKSEKKLLFFTAILVSGMDDIIFNILDSILKLG